MHTYRIILTQEPEGGYTVNVPSLPGCITYGDNVNRAMDMAKEAIEGYLEVLKEQGTVVPMHNKDVAKGTLYPFQITKSFRFC